MSNAANRTVSIVLRICFLTFLTCKKLDIYICIYISSLTSHQLSWKSIAIEPVKYNSRVKQIAQVYLNESVGQKVRARKILLLADQQLQDPFLNRIIFNLIGNPKAVENNIRPDNDQRSLSSEKLIKHFFLDMGTDVLSINMNNQHLIVITYSLKKAYFQ